MVVNLAEVELMSWQVKPLSVGGRHAPSATDLTSRDNLSILQQPV
jgi:hypothetical protein